MMGSILEVYKFTDYVCWFPWSGALTDIRNNESKMAFDLAKDPETAALLQHAGESPALVT